MKKNIKKQLIELEMSIINEDNQLKRAERLVASYKSKNDELRAYRDELLEKFTQSENDHVLTKQYLEQQVDLNKKLMTECKIQDNCIKNIRQFFEKVQSEYVQMNVCKNQVLAYIKKMGL